MSSPGGRRAGHDEENLKVNIKDLVEQLKKKSYRPQPVRRTYIPKDAKSKRPPLGNE
ncbi:DNA polymerase [Paenibacillus polymyxa]|nr:DNA polymerase [Paenibacillus polymyxa]